MSACRHYERTIMRINIIGIDCATDPTNVGIAFGRFSNGHTIVETVQIGSRRKEPSRMVADWLEGQSDPTLLALDAPLGWPKALAEELNIHTAGRMFKFSAHSLFRRSTDIFIKEKIGKQPLDVGADRIARTAYSALAFLDQLRNILGHDIKLAWDPKISGISVIEVYPAATLMAHGIDTRGYKSPEGEKQRQKVIADLKLKMTVLAEIPCIEKRSDSVDAIACVLAGQDFLSGIAPPPIDGAAVEIEGWIWVRRPNFKNELAQP